MRAFLLTLAMAVIAAGTACADPPAHRAGFVRLTIQDREPFDTIVWYPTDAVENSFQAGPFKIDAARGAEIAAGDRFPVILLSHGRRGSPLAHRELAAHLARSGFIVVAPTHVGDSAGQTTSRSQRQILADRPRQARLALDRVLSDHRFLMKADLARIGALDYSAGG